MITSVPRHLAVSDVIIDNVVNARMESGSNPLKLYTGLFHITSEMAAPIQDLSGVRFVKNNLLNMKLFYTLPLDEYPKRVRTLQVDAAVEAISVPRAKQVISDHFKTTVFSI